LESQKEIEEMVFRQIAAQNQLIDSLKNDINLNHRRFNEFAGVMKENI